MRPSVGICVGLFLSVGTGACGEAPPQTARRPSVMTQGEASASSTPCPIDACGRGTPLELGASWLGSVLDAAKIDYVNEYRADEGGGHFVRKWSMFVSALSPEPDPSAWAMSHGYRPYWESNGVTVFGSHEESESHGYFYWHAGGVDTWVEFGLTRELATPQDFRAVIVRITTEQERNTYPGQI